MLGPPVRTQTLSLILAMHKSYVLCSQWNPKDEFNAAVWVKDLKWLEASKNPHDLNNSQLPHHKISSSHIKREHSWTILVTKPQNHAKPSFLHKPDFAGFSRPFHEVFTVFSWPLHVFYGVAIFAYLKVRPQFCKHGISLGVGPPSANYHNKMEATNPNVFTFLDYE